MIVVVGDRKRIVCDVKRGDIIDGVGVTQNCDHSAVYAIPEKSKPNPLYLCLDHGRALRNQFIPNLEVIHVC